MKHIAFLLLAAASSLAALALGSEATRPRYGDQLRMEIHALVTDLDPASKPAGPDAAAAKQTLMPLVYETLIGFDDQGRPEPILATSWQADARRTRWELMLRPVVKFHDGTPLTPAFAASALAAILGDRRVSATDKSVVITSDQPMPDLLWELSEPESALVFRDADGKLRGTGPFQIADWHVPKALLIANQSYWGGRPFLDGIALEMGRSFRDQSLDLEIGKADLVELSPQEARRTAANTAIVWSSASVELMALVFNRVNPAQQEIRKALALSIDRAAIHSVLAQGRGEIAAGLLPGWLSGYEFLFSPQQESGTAARPPGRATVNLVLSCDGADPLAKATADRIAVDARKVGIVIRTTAAGSGADADLRLVRVRIPISSSARAIRNLAVSVGLGDRVMTPSSSSTDGGYEIERALLDDQGVIPLLHLPDMYAAGARIRSWNTPGVGQTGTLHLENIWLVADKL